MKQAENETFRYQFLSRLQLDCDYFLGCGDRREKHLWALNVKDHIEEMRKAFDSLPVKPEWITIEDIENYSLKMSDGKDKAEILKK